MEETEPMASISATRIFWIIPRIIQRWHSTPWHGSRQSGFVEEKPVAIFGSGDRQRLNVIIVSSSDSNLNGQTDTDFVSLPSLAQPMHGLYTPCKCCKRDYYALWWGFFLSLAVQVLDSNTSGLVWKLSRSMLRLFPRREPKSKAIISFFGCRAEDCVYFGLKTATGWGRRNKRCQQKLLYLLSTRRWRKV